MLYMKSGQKILKLTYCKSAKNHWGVDMQGQPVSTKGLTRDLRQDSSGRTKSVNCCCNSRTPSCAQGRGHSNVRHGIAIVAVAHHRSSKIWTVSLKGLSSEIDLAGNGINR
jgi:hypothetical protein